MHRCLLTSRHEKHRWGIIDPKRLRSAGPRAILRVTLQGFYDTGIGDASNWGIEDIQRVTGWNVVRGTVNVRLEGRHTLRQPPDFHLPEKERADGRDEDLSFERCVVILPDERRVRGLIAQTGRHAWGDGYLEIMAEERLIDRYALEDGTPLRIVVWSGADAAIEAAQATGDLTA